VLQLSPVAFGGCPDVMSLDTEPKQPVIRVGVLLSGQGSNAKALYAAQQAEGLGQARIVVVGSNRPEAGGVVWAKAQGLPTVTFTAKQFSSKLTRDAWLVEQLQAYQLDLLVLAGYDRILTEPLLAAYAGRLLNIHPSLLPRHGGVGMVGLAVHTAVLAAGDTASGCTVHEVTAEVDAGKVLGQARVPVLPTDTPETLAKRVLAAEHKLYPAVVASWQARR
jgi:phosphoribosylglycinamide formyltransferase-1